jgi:hypothetical protein
MNINQLLSVSARLGCATKTWSACRFSTKEVLGLAGMRRLPHALLLSVASDYGGHIQLLVLFDRSSTQGCRGVSHEKTPLDHLAPTTGPAEHAA